MGFVDDHLRLVADHLSPAADHLGSVDDHLRPAADHLRPAADHLGSVDDHLRPAADHLCPAADHLCPARVCVIRQYPILIILLLQVIGVRRVNPAPSSLGCHCRVWYSHQDSPLVIPGNIEVIPEGQYPYE